MVAFNPIHELTIEGCNRTDLFGELVIYLQVIREQVILIKNIKNNAPKVFFF